MLTFGFRSDENLVIIKIQIGHGYGMFWEKAYSIPA